MTPFIGCFSNNQFHRGSHPKVIASVSLADPGFHAGSKDNTARVPTLHTLREIEKKLVQGWEGMLLRLCPKPANDLAVPSHVRFP